MLVLRSIKLFLRPFKVRKLNQRYDGNYLLIDETFDGRKHLILPRTNMERLTNDNNLKFDEEIVSSYAEMIQKYSINDSQGVLDVLNDLIHKNKLKPDHWLTSRIVAVTINALENEHRYSEVESFYNYFLAQGLYNGESVHWSMINTLIKTRKFEEALDIMKKVATNCKSRSDRYLKNIVKLMSPFLANNNELVGVLESIFRITRDSFVLSCYISNNTGKFDSFTDDSIVKLFTAIIKKTELKKKPRFNSLVEALQHDEYKLVQSVFNWMDAINAKFSDQITSLIKEWFKVYFRDMVEIATVKIKTTDKPICSCCGTTLKHAPRTAEHLLPYRNTLSDFIQIIKDAAKKIGQPCLDELLSVERMVNEHGPFGLLVDLHNFDYDYVLRSALNKKGLQLSDLVTEFIDKDRGGVVLIYKEAQYNYVSGLLNDNKFLKTFSAKYLNDDIICLYMTAYCQLKSLQKYSLEANTDNQPLNESTINGNDMILTRILSNDSFNDHLIHFKGSNKILFKQWINFYRVSILTSNQFKLKIPYIIKTINCTSSDYFYDQNILNETDQPLQLELDRLKNDDASQSLYPFNWHFPIGDRWYCITLVESQK